MSTHIAQYIPNLLSLSRLLSAGVIAVLLAVPHALWIAQVLIAVGIVTDKLDGTLARLWKVESDLGKRIESIADPLFIFFSALYGFVLLDYPGLLFIGFFIIGFVANASRILAGLITGKMFYEKSQITRVGTAIAMITIFIYIFQIPYREWTVWPAFIYGVFMGVNYMRMVIQFVLRERTTVK